jgi:hypothetical protein
MKNILNNYSDEHQKIVPFSVLKETGYKKLNLLNFISE